MPSQLDPERLLELPDGCSVKVIDVEGLTYDKDLGIISVRMKNGIGHHFTDHLPHKTMGQSYRFMLREISRTRPRYRTRQRHTKLWACLDALEIHETWYVPDDAVMQGDRTKLAYAYNLGKKNEVRQFTVMKPQPGILFVRIA